MQKKKKKTQPVLYSEKPGINNQIDIKIRSEKWSKKISSV